jgi:hypothetical protein
MFSRQETQAGGLPGRYQVEIISGQIRQKSHQKDVQETLNEGSAKGWRLVSATTTNVGGAYVTGIYWDTTPE